MKKTYTLKMSDMVLLFQLLGSAGSPIWKNATPLDSRKINTFCSGDKGLDKIYAEKEKVRVATIKKYTTKDEAGNDKKDDVKINEEILALFEKEITLEAETESLTLVRDKIEGMPSLEGLNGRGIGRICQSLEDAKTIN